MTRPFQSSSPSAFLTRALFGSWGELYRDVGCTIHAALDGELSWRAQCQWWFGPRFAGGVLLATRLVFVFGEDSEGEMG